MEPVHSFEHDYTEYMLQYTALVVFTTDFPDGFDRNTHSPRLKLRE